MQTAPVDQLIAARWGASEQLSDTEHGNRERLQAQRILAERSAVAAEARHATQLRQRLIEAEGNNVQALNAAAAAVSD